MKGLKMYKILTGHKKDMWFLVRANGDRDYIVGIYYSKRKAVKALENRC